MVYFQGSQIKSFAASFQRLWRKKRYQYLQYFMLPKHLRYEPEPEFNTGHRTGGGTSSETVAGHNEDSNGSNNNSNEKVSILAPLRQHLPSKLLEKVKIKKKMTIESYWVTCYILSSSVQYKITLHTIKKAICTLILHYVI